MRLYWRTREVGPDKDGWMRYERYGLPMVRLNWDMLLDWLVMLAVGWIRARDGLNGPSGNFGADCIAMKEMLTEAEKCLLENIGRLANQFSSIAKTNAETDGKQLNPQDMNEIVHHIHALQNWVMSNATARAYPDQFRPFGVSHKDVEIKCPF